MILQPILNYKSFYEVFRQGVVDNGYTAVARLLFKPFYDMNSSVAVNMDSGMLFGVDNQNANTWGKGTEPIPREVKTTAGKNEALDALIQYFSSEEFQSEIVDALREEMLDAMVNLVQSCSNLPTTVRTKILKCYASNKHAEFLARTFQRALLANNKVSTPKRKKKATEKNSESLDEFDRLLNRRRKKPKTDVPKTVQPQELGYVSQLYVAYGQIAPDANITQPDDLDAINMREHFEFQRKTYYLAETVHQGTRDTVQPDEDDPFDTLKDEIEIGIFEAKRGKYADAVKRIDVIVGVAGSVVLSTGVDNATFQWVGPGEKKGVCHMLVNDGRLRWIV